MWGFAPSLEELAKHDQTGPLISYLVYGFDPGSFYTALFANDAFAAMQHSHPANRIANLKMVTNFVQNYFPKGTAWGSYEAVSKWVKLSDSDRRTCLAECGLVLTPEQEVWAVLQGAHEHYSISDWNRFVHAFDTRETV